MTRLFISLYMVVTVALGIIGWASESIWQQTQQANDEDIRQMAQLAQLLPSKVTEKQLTEFSLASGIATQSMAATDITFLPAQQVSLAQGLAIINYGEQDELYFYLLRNDSQLVQFGPIATQPENRYAAILQLSSYLLLGFFILLWSWPLWRDLTRLTNLANAFGKGQFDTPSDIAKASVIYPISLAFSNMAGQISRLMDEQRLMFNAVSHDLRTPLARLKFATAMLPQQQEQPIAQDIAEIETLLDEILNYGRLDSEQSQMEFHTVDVAELLTNLVNKLSRNSDKSINLTTELELSCFCDGHLLERACQNLITNGIRYSQKEVQVSLYKQSNSLVIKVEDDGLGIDDADKDTIFKPFKRLEPSRNKKQGGFGLGLAIVKRVMEWHKGDCTVMDSKLGGACFKLVIPVGKSL